jgi:hypothetical protein
VNSDLRSVCSDWLLPLLLGGAAVACSGRPSTPQGSCHTDSSPQLACGAGLVGYSCAGAQRPDEATSDSVGGIPRGTICTDMGKLEGDDNKQYCCTQGLTMCAYDPVLGCAAPAYGYQCRGSDRPEALDPNLFCGEGVVEGDLINYCCSGSMPSQGCAMSTNAVCPSTLVAWTCHDQSLPTEAELGSNQSRADFNHLICSIPVSATTPSGTSINYCCYTPPLLPIGGSCLSDITVPQCAAGSFGFACTGPDRPDQDYARIECPGSGVPGKRADGYPATLYCCQYQ